MLLPLVIEVELYFLTEAEGGRKMPAFSGYRPQFHYDGQDWSALHEYIGVEKVEPGQTVRAYLTLYYPHIHAGKLGIGKQFLIREGARTVAKGHITDLLELEESYS